MWAEIPFVFLSFDWETLQQLSESFAGCVFLSHAVAVDIVGVADWLEVYRCVWVSWVCSTGIALSTHFELITFEQSVEHASNFTSLHSGSTIVFLRFDNGSAGVCVCAVHVRLRIARTSHTLHYGSDRRTCFRFSNQQSAVMSCQTTRCIVNTNSNSKEEKTQKGFAIQLLTMQNFNRIRMWVKLCATAQHKRDPRKSSTDQKKKSKWILTTIPSGWGGGGWKRTNSTWLLACKINLDLIIIVHKTRRNSSSRTALNTKWNAKREHIWFSLRIRRFPLKFIHFVRQQTQKAGTFHPGGWTSIAIFPGKNERT